MSGYADLRGVCGFRPLERPVRCLGRVSQFSAPWSRTVEDLARELRHLQPQGAAILQIDLRERDFRTPGVVLSLDSRRVGHALRYEVGTFNRWQDNVRAIALGLAALRAVDRYGITRSAEQYASWRQLPSGGPSAQRGQDLIRQHGSVTAALRATHPDHGGDPADFADVQAAREARA